MTSNRIQKRRDTASNWTAANPILASGEPGYETDTKRQKTGDGVTAWTSLAYTFDKTSADPTYAPKAKSPFLTDAAYVPPNGYNQQNSIYNLTGVNWKYARQALARARQGTGLCRVAVIADSIGTGYHATAQNADSWPSVMREYLSTKLGYPASGTGDVMCGTLGIYSASSPDPRWTGNWTLPASAGASGGIGISSTASGLIHTFTTDKAGTIAEFSYGTQTTWTGTFTVTVKNNAGTILSGPTSYNCTGATGVQRVSIPSLVMDVGSTIIFTSTNTGVNVVLTAGVRNATGLLVSNYGIGTSGTTMWNNYAASTSGYSSAYTVRQLLLANPPDILLIALGTNDALNTQGSACTPALFATNLASIVANYKGANTSVALLHPIPASGVVWSGTNTNGYTSSTFYAQADSLNVPLLDESDRWQDYVSANASGLMFDTVHPNSVGYQRLGLDVANLMSA